MTNLRVLKSGLRSVLSAPFQLDRRDQPPGVHFELIASHRAQLHSPSIADHDTAMAAFRGKQWDLRDFVATIRGPVFLDTGLGWVVRGRDLLKVGNWSLVDQSPIPTKPSILRWAQSIIKADLVGSVVWLPFGAGNYFHFLNDLVAGLALLDSRRDLSGCAVLVPVELAAKPFFKEVIALSSRLSALDWTIYRHDRWLRASQVHVAGTSFGSYATLRRAIGLLDRLPPISSSTTRRLFITRRSDVGRNPANLGALQAELGERGFEHVQFEGLTVIEQRAIINTAGVVVATHGAGMTNLAFHEPPKDVKLFEITPYDHLNPCFAFMAEEAGMDYFCFAGGPRDFKNQEAYEVPINDLLRALDTFLAR